MKSNPSRLADHLHRRLEEEIFAGELVPGSRLDETRLAGRFGVSRTPVREALLKLASAGLVEMRPRQGAVVAKITVQELLQMFEVMAELEAFCARLAARRMTEAERQNLRKVHARCGKLAKRADPDAYYDANREFHEVIYAGGHNMFLEDSTRNLRNRLSPFRRFQLRHHGRLQTSWSEHDAVVQALLDGDPERAEQALRSHVAIQGDVFTDLVSTLPPTYLQAVSA